MYDTFEKNKPLRELSTFGIGGPAKFFKAVKTIEELKELVSFCYREKLPYIVIGKGSNCLFHDLGFNGLVILNKIDFYHLQEEQVHVGAGFSFSLLGAKTAMKGFGNLEFASGIPGTVGGAVYMNAGAGGSETAIPLISVEAISREGEYRLFLKEEISFSYRHSAFQENGYAIAAATFHLEKNLTAREKQLSILNYRLKTQPYQEKSIGCFFKNPQGKSAGALIDQLGLKGHVKNDAAVSEVHANFVINKDAASAKDILALKEEIQEIVLKKTGIMLETEVRIIPYEKEWNV